MALLKLLLVSACAFSAASSEGGDGGAPPSLSDAMRDPAVVQQALKMLQNPMVMQQMRVMMQDPAVKQRMQKMLSKLGADSGMDPSLSDPAMLDKLFERMQDPEMLEKLEAHTKNESFVERMQQLAADPKFAAAATGYVEDMAKDVLGSEDANKLAALGRIHHRHMVEAPPQHQLRHLLHITRRQDGRRLRHGPLHGRR